VRDADVGQAHLLPRKINLLVRRVASTVRLPANTKGRRAHSLVSHLGLKAGSRGRRQDRTRVLQEVTSKGHRPVNIEGSRAHSRRVNHLHLKAASRGRRWDRTRVLQVVSKVRRPVNIKGRRAVRRRVNLQGLKAVSKGHHRDHTRLLQAEASKGRRPVNIKGRRAGCRRVNIQGLKAVSRDRTRDIQVVSRVRLPVNIMDLPGVGRHTRFLRGKVHRNNIKGRRMAFTQRHQASIKANMQGHQAHNQGRCRFNILQRYMITARTSARIADILCTVRKWSHITSLRLDITALSTSSATMVTAEAATYIAGTLITAGIPAALPRDLPALRNQGRHVSS
jgi:hypothetical protein